MLIAKKAGTQGILWFLAITLLFVATLLSMSPPASAQVSTASIKGTVQDSSGAVIAGAQIKATQIDTQGLHSATSGEDGSFTIPLLPVGSYTLDVQFSGFSPYKQTGIVLNVGQVASINISLSPGSVSQTVEVTANAQIVETTSSNSSTLVNTAQVEGLPLNGRNPATLVFLTAGASNPVQNIVTSNTGNGNLTNSLVYPTEIAPNVHGVRAGGVYFSLDGANNIDVFEVSGGPFPNPDATQEFNVVSGNYGSQYVSAPGGAVNIVTKSGTNQIHGDVFEFVRNGLFDARNFFSATPDVLKRNQFGATLGAPIKRNKWFIFGSYEGTRLANELGGNVAFVPSDAERTGDFSQLLPTKIKDPFTGLQYMGNSGTQPNVIPTALLDPTMQNYLKYIPSVAAPLGATVIPQALNNKVIFTTPVSQVQEEYVIKSDWLFKNHAMFGRFFKTTFVWKPEGFVGGDALSGFRGQNQDWINAAFGDTWTKGNLVSNFRFAYIRDMSVTVAGEHGVSLTSLGAKISQGEFPTIQGLNVTGGFSTPFGNYNGFPRNTIVGSEDINFFHGRHQISFGANLQHINILFNTDNQEYGQAAFTGAETGNALADFIIGIEPAYAQSDGIDDRGTGWLPGFYGEDRFKATSRLTLTGGMRWDPFIPFNSVRMECFVAGEQSKVFTNAPVGLIFPGDPGCNPRGTTNHYGTGLIQPRLGFAYQLGSSGKTVVRGGYGFYNTQFNLVNFLAFGNVQPFERNIAISTSSKISISNPWASFPGGDPFASGFQLNLDPRPSNAPFLTPVNVVLMDPHFQMPYIQQWSLILERAIATNDVIDLSYFGTKGTKLGYITPTNQATYVPGTAGAGCTVGQYLTTAAGQPCSTTANIQSRRPDTLLNTANMLQGGGSSIYHGVEIEYHHRFHAGFTLSSAFTYERSIDATSTPAGLLLNGGAVIPDPLNPAQRRGPSDFNQPTTWRTSGVWNLPFGKNYKGVTGVLVKGWVASGIFTREAGLPLNISTTNTDNSLTNNGQDVANVVPGVARRQPISDFTAASQNLSIINPAAFVVNPVGTYGVSGRNGFNTPGLTNVDTSVSKIFTMSERFRFQFRAEWFNALNHPQFYFPGATTLGSGTFGKLTNARDPRIMQFSGKLIF